MGGMDGEATAAADLAGGEAPRPVGPEGHWAADVAVLAGAGGLTVLLLFLLFSAVEQGLGGADAETIGPLHTVRGVSTSLITGAVIALVARGQHQRRRARLEAEVRERTAEAHSARTLLEAVFDHAPTGLLVLDRDYRILAANRTSERIHGRALGGGRCRDVMACDSMHCDRCPARAVFEGVADDDAAATELDRYRTDGRTGEVVIVESHPLRLPDGTGHALLVERVVTEQRKLQARLIHQEKMAAFGLLAAGIAHDLGNPLSAVALHLQLLEGIDLPGDAASSLAAIRDEAARLQRTLRELVDFARRRRDEASLVSVRTVVEDAVRLLRHDGRARAVAMTVEADRETPPVRIVEDHLMQVVLNLFLNALDAMPSGGTLRAEVGVVQGQVALRVHDTGVGMDRAVLSRCLEPLFTTKEAGRGTGLGLSITRDILLDAGGQIEVHSAPGCGTSVIVTLPAAGSEEGA